MAEVVGPARGGAGDPELQDVAIAMRGALPPRQRRNADLFRGNRAVPAKQTRFEEDTDRIVKLAKSGKVNPAELCSFRAPQIVLNQGVEIDPSNNQILETANDMSFTRRIVLELQLDGLSNSTQAKGLLHQLAVWPADIQQLQGQVEGIGGRSLKIPDVLLKPVQLLP